MNLVRCVVLGFALARTLDVRTSILSSNRYRHLVRDTVRVRGVEEQEVDIGQDVAATDVVDAVDCVLDVGRPTRGGEESAPRWTYVPCCW